MSANPNIVVSNGFSKFPLSDLAAELHVQGRLGALLTGAYPKRKSILGGAQTWLLCNIKSRFEDRHCRVPEEMIYTYEASEALYALSRKIRFMETSQRMRVLAFRLYQHSTAKFLASLEPNSALFLCRAGFGGDALRQARKHGIRSFVYHSVAHPMEMAEFESGATGGLPPVEGLILDDIDNSDHLIVEGDYVRKSCQAHGVPAHKMSVVVQGVDERFVDYFGKVKQTPRNESAPPRVLFVGSGSVRKGFDLMINILGDRDLSGIQFEVIGEISSDFSDVFNSLRATRSNISHLILTREGVAERMAAADILIHPTRADGAARATFEALASGLYVLMSTACGTPLRPDLGRVLEDLSPDAFKLALIEVCGEIGRLRQSRDLRRMEALRDCNQKEFGRSVLRVMDAFASTI